MKYFHMHIYFEENQLQEALLWSSQLKGLKFFDVVKFFERPVGPHSTGMIETNFSETHYAAAIEWIKTNRGNFSVLIHQDTGDDYHDHTNGILWLGKVLPLKFDFFDLIQTNSELRIHK